MYDDQKKFQGARSPLGDEDGVLAELQMVGGF